MVARPVQCPVSLISCKHCVVVFAAAVCKVLARSLRAFVKRAGRSTMSKAAHELRTTTKDGVKHAVTQHSQTQRTACSALGNGVSSWATGIHDEPHTEQPCGD
eukprot:3104685-Karenia_brevis.AAC.1